MHDGHNEQKKFKIEAVSTTMGVLSVTCSVVHAPAGGSVWQTDSHIAGHRGVECRGLSLKIFIQ